MNYLSILTHTFDVFLGISTLYLYAFSVIVFSLSIKREIETYSMSQPLPTIIQVLLTYFKLSSISLISS